jgi:hypothetical protein
VPKNKDETRHLADTEDLVGGEAAVLRECPPPASGRVVEPSVAGEVDHVILLIDGQDRDIQRITGFGALDAGSLPSSSSSVPTRGSLSL